MAKRWTEGEKGFLRRNWQRVETIKVAGKLNRTVGSVRCMAELLNLCRRRETWSREELHKLEVSWSRGGRPLEIAKLLNRSVDSVRHKSQKMGFKFGPARQCLRTRSGEIKVCSICGGTFYVKKCLLGKQKYCSWSCYIKSPEPQKQLQKMLRANGMHGPNKPETFLCSLLDEYFPGAYMYNGDYSRGVTLGGLIPDFVNVNGKKQVIELFGEYWHDKKKNMRWKSTEFGRRAVFSQLGFKLLVIWEHELKSPEEVIEKIREFNR